MPDTSTSFGNCFHYHHQHIPLFWPPASLQELLPPATEAGSRCLAYGQGRSYGDSCLNQDNILLPTAGLDRLLSFDRERGILRAEAGLSLSELLSVIIPSGWFLPVLPGTQQVSLGGALANDIHGKNHHRRGTFGSWVRRFALLRSEEEKFIVCSPEENAALFRASIGGLGLTGLVLWVELQLCRASPFIRQESIKFKNLDEFFVLSAQAAARHEYTVAWMDLSARGAALGRGIFFCGNHLEGEELSRRTPDIPSRGWLSVPCHAPEWLLSRRSIGLFNQLYYHRQWVKKKSRVLAYQKFFFPLDGISSWNRLYGKRGLSQYQMVIPQKNSTMLPRIFEVISASGLASFLAVFKEFGEIPSPGLMSFPRAGYTLALDFANTGEPLRRLFSQLDTLVGQAEGRLYPAKDGHMSGSTFKEFYPAWKEFSRLIDPRFSSSFWRRVMDEG